MAEAIYLIYGDEQERRQGFLTATLLGTAVALSLTIAATFSVHWFQDGLRGLALIPW